MKKIILLVFFMVTWKEFDTYFQGGTVQFLTNPPSDNSGCKIYPEDKQKKFDTKEEAQKFILDHELDLSGKGSGDPDYARLKFNYKLFEGKEIK